MRGDQPIYNATTGYTLQSTDIGYMVSCEVRYTDGHGYDEIILVNIDSLPASSN